MPVTVLALSGGLTSAALLWQLRRDRHRVHAVFVDYGQESAGRELQACERLVDAFNRDRKEGEEADLSVVTLAGFPREILPTHGAPPAGEFARVGLLLFSAAMAHAIARDAQALALGLTVERRPDESMHLHLACLLGGVGAERIAFNARYHDRTRGQVLQQAQKLQLEVPWEKSWSCLLPGPWHCGTCRGCRDRRRAFVAAGAQDLTKYQVDDGHEGPTLLPIRAGGDSGGDGRVA